MFRENLLGSFLFLAQTITPTTAAAATTDQQWPLPNTQPLRFTPNGTFQISVFEDLHYGEGWYSDLFRGTKDSFHVASDPLPLTRLLAEDLDWGPQQDVDSERVINTVLDAESPQLVILNGDLITGENAYLANSSLYVDEIVRPLVQRGLTWHPHTAIMTAISISQVGLCLSESTRIPIVAHNRWYPVLMQG
jgi:hypothetical protein